jgi:hypothetical protein
MFPYTNTEQQETTMTQRTRDRDNLLLPRNGAGEGAPDGTNLQERRREGEGLLDVGDDAIRKALSGNSRDFLLHSRQRGGE